MTDRTCDRVLGGRNGVRCAAPAVECVAGVERPQSVHLCQTCIREMRANGCTVRVFDVFAPSRPAAPQRPTPKPWRVETVETSIGSCHKIEPIGACLYVDNMKPCDAASPAWQEPLANARLLAAAPDLAEALEEVLAHVVVNAVSRGAVARARAALAKAGVLDAPAPKERD